MGELSYDEISKVWAEHNVYDLLTAKYRKEIEERFDWDQLVAELDAGEFTETNDGDTVSRLLLGTVFTLYPSGKYYTPWACGNVTPKEALKDECWSVALEAHLERLGLWGEGGEGDPCDIFICKLLDETDDDCKEVCHG